MQRSQLGLDFYQVQLGQDSISESSAELIQVVAVTWLIDLDVLLWSTSARVVCLCWTHWMGLDSIGGVWLYWRSLALLAESDSIGGVNWMLAHLIGAEYCPSSLRGRISRRRLYFVDYPLSLYEALNSISSVWGCISWRRLYLINLTTRPTMKLPNLSKKCMGFWMVSSFDWAILLLTAISHKVLQ